jgi:prophage maintenance system killer protein
MVINAQLGAMVAFLYQNGYEVAMSTDMAEELVLSVTVGEVSKEEAANKIRACLIDSASI